MIGIVYSPSFWQSTQKLSPKLQNKLTDLSAVLRHNPFTELLHTKKLSGQMAGLFSFRITRDWRVIFRFLEPQLIQLIAVKNRKEIYR